jgi:hypothetical protein
MTNESLILPKAGKSTFLGLGFWMLDRVFRLFSATLKEPD